MSLVFCGTESPNVLSLKLLPDGKVEITQRLPVSSNPLALKYGSPGGIAVEWVTVHPRGDWLFALVCFWDRAPGELHAFTFDSDGKLTPEGHVLSGGYQPPGRPRRWTLAR